MLGINPQCFNCKHYRDAPCTIGKSPACGKYPKGRPKGVFYDGACKCEKFKPQQIHVGGRKKKRKGLG